MTDWYEQNIELKIRPIVKLLRDNGVNTDCSCGHSMYVQCQYIPDGFLQNIDSILFNAGFRDYEMNVLIVREDGHLRSYLNIKFKN